MCICLSYGGLYKDNAQYMLVNMIRCITVQIKTCIILTTSVTHTFLCILNLIVSNDTSMSLHNQRPYATCEWDLLVRWEQLVCWTWKLLNSFQRAFTYFLQNSIERSLNYDYYTKLQLDRVLVWYGERQCPWLEGILRQTCHGGN